MRILSEAVLPQTCYAAEVALWIALGRVPRVLHKHSDLGEDYSEDTGDPRSSRGGFDEDWAIVPYDTGFSAEEFRAIGIEADFERYKRIRRYTAVTFPHLRLPISGARGIESLEMAAHYHDVLSRDKPGYKPRVLNDEAIERRRIVIEELDWATVVDTKCETFIDLARAEVFRALANGSLKAKAWTEAPGEVEFLDRHNTALITIPTDRWTFRNFDWDESTLKTGEESYYGVQVLTSDMLAVFPRPQCLQQPVDHLECYPSCMVVDDGAGATARAPSVNRAGRGRPAKGGGLIRKAVINVFGQKAKKGELPDKNEAVVQEIIDFVALAFEETLSRSTAQQYMKALPEKMPVNRAG